MGGNLSSNHPEHIESKLIASITIPAAMLMAFLAAAPAARSEDVARGQQIWHDKAECNFCHGWAGDGAATSGFHHEGNPPSLRKTQLTRDQIRMTIQCGRPGTPMPHFDRFAYTDKRCYGMTAADLGDQTPQRAGTTLQRDEIDALADYVAAKIKGAGPVTKAECLVYFGGKSSNCDSFPDTKSGSSH
jgi:mono/diheme cytochrome c family protein